MCGIAGIFYLNEQRVAETTLQRFNNSQQHRGPDGDGIFINEEGSLGLAHRRLSILDTSEQAKQPMSYNNGRYWITYNGEIYNFLELRRELKSLGRIFRTESDTEVILAAYATWGIECLNKFNGMWAFAIWDEQEKKLVLSRDRFGIKPLHLLWIQNNVLAFASETVAFKHLDGFRRQINTVHLAAVLQDPFILEGYGRTIFQNIEQLPGGHYCIFRKGDEKLNFVRWWNTLDHIREVPDKFEDQVQEFRELLFDSCRLRLRSDVPIATALSGGLDSSSIYSSIKMLAKSGAQGERLPSDWQAAFVATFPGASNDEREYAEEVIRFVDGKGTFTVADESRLMSHITGTTEMFDSVYNSPVSVAVDVYKAMRAQGYKVSLDGHGVDEMLYGYPHMLVPPFRAFMSDKNSLAAEELNRTYVDLFTIPVDDLFKKFPGKPAPVTTASVKQQAPSLARRIYGKLRRMSGTSHSAVKQVPKPRTGWSDAAYLRINENEFYPGFHSLTDTDKDIFRIFHMTTLPTILRNFDRASMQSGVEIRMPFMDWRLVTFVFSLPLESKVGRGFTKLILREAMKGILPENIRTRKNKIGFNAPMPVWFGNQLKDLIESEVNSELFSSSGIWDSASIKQFVAERSKHGWTWHDCNRFWPYLNAHLIMKSERNV